MGKNDNMARLNSLKKKNLHIELTAENLWNLNKKKIKCAFIRANICIYN